MLRLAAFADEISPDIDEQVRACRDNAVTHVELRGVSNRNVLDFDPTLRADVRAKLADNGMGVISIGSPVGKVKINDPWPRHFDRFKLAVDAAEYFDAPFIRIFSYYPPEQDGARGNILDHRAEVLDRMARKADYLAGRNVTLVHENEKDIYGEKGRQCVDIMESVASPKLRSAFDFANFVQVGERPRDNWPGLKPYTAHIHIKDALLKDGKNVPAGQGDGDIEPILVDAYRSGYRGFLSLEPHLAAAGQFSGFSGPGFFKLAADALKAICARNDIPLAGV